MSPFSNIMRRFRQARQGSRKPAHRPLSKRPVLEQLEDRQLMSVDHGPLMSVIPHGGPVLQNVEVETVFLGSDWYNNASLNQQMGMINDYLNYLTNSSYMDMLAQYGVGRGQCSNGGVVPINLGPSIDKIDIQNGLESLINSGTLPGPDNNRLYVVFLAPNVELTDGLQNSHNNFLGFHTWDNNQGFPFAIIDYPGGINAQDFPNPIDQITAVTSHELAEAVTDPKLGTGWFDGDLSHEIGDIVNHQCVYLNGWLVQKEASQTEEAMTPAGATEPVSGQDITAISGQTFNGTVSTFLVNYWASGDLTATINWGDGNISAGQIVRNADGSYAVQGSNTYAQAGTYTVVVQITDAKYTETSTSTATVASVNPGPMPVHLHDVAIALTTSAEYYANRITTAYEQYLGRAPDAAGLAGWVSRMQNGLTDEQLEAGFIGSAEYIQNHGGTGQAWVVGLYQDLLGRTPDATGLSYWLTKLQQGATPYSIAYGFAASAEREGQRVVADYQGYLGRSPSAAEVNAWVDRFINHGQTNEQVIAGFIASQEYYQNHYSDPRDWLFAAYRATLGRDPDSAGLQSWLNVLASP